MARWERLLGVSVILSCCFIGVYWSYFGSDTEMAPLPEPTQHDLLPADYINTDYVLQRPKFLLFGDSLTERAFSVGGWAGALAHYFYRKVDVISRGFGGYNTRWAKHLMKDVFNGVDGTNTKLVTVFFGANDAARANGPPHSARQHVPIPEYADNLKQMVAYIRGLGVQTIVLMTPPPVHDAGRKEWQVLRVGKEASDAMPLDRTNEHTAGYAAACLAVGKELGVPCVDLYGRLQKEQEWGPSLFTDGLHFSPLGNAKVFEALLDTLASAYPDLKPEALPLHFPWFDQWDFEQPENTAAQIEALRQKGPFAVGKMEPKA
ncbi:SGNH hydrolase-type esterase domain-containing protein [Dunaliella salina]|uniref:SGNH hydrolase-type esterase domain-containing protein n=1 Tax=Dunaliella salina TaxID=3046 RepID=A0ABQ7GLR9_DUNSA|nr:SGNH hydrolase-type esterase domain-containing protein [Dunaliella salina]|eukprot:KAF5835556.1 SGNH hydrolase-type esterase domain-containing protein [Dunaliella salina]